MARGHRWSQRRESGAELVEWIIVTLILILAMFAILQVIGGDVEAILEHIREFVGGMGL